MFTKEIKLEAREMLKKDDNLYFPGIWLMIIPLMVLSLFMGKIFSGGVEDFVIGIVAVAIFAFFSCWLVTWITNLIYSKKTVRGSLPRVNVLLPYIIIYIVQYIISQFFLRDLEYHGFIKFLIFVLSLIITYLFAIFMQIMVIDNLKRDGIIEYGIVLSTTIRAIPKIIILELSFIPLYLLIGITFGILMFWKATYMQTTCMLLLSKIYDENN